MILGLNYSSYHDSSVAIIDDQCNLLLAQSEERLSRIKNDGRFPKQCINNINLDLINTVAVPYLEASNSEIYKDDLFANILIDASNQITAYPSNWYDKLNSLKKPVKYFDHHECHAYAALFYSKINNCNIITSDFGADNTSSSFSVYNYSNKKMKLLHYADIRVYEPLCSIYSFVTTILGYRPNSHEGKITGLAATAVKRLDCEEKLLEIFSLYLLERQTEPLLSWRGRFNDEISPYILVNRKKMSEYRSYLSSFSDAEISRSVQEIIESKFNMILNRLSLDYSTPLLLSGGIFSNVKLNYEILKKGFSSLSVCPPMGDEGLAVGAAYNYFNSMNQDKIIKYYKASIYTGMGFSNGKLDNFFSKAILSNIPNDLSSTVASLLADNKSVAIVQNKMEFGPRSLGNRSILHSASDKNINNTLNKKLRRTEFMPFAPVIRDTVAPKYFDQKEIFNSKDTLSYMTMCLSVSSEFKNLCPAVVHIDNTCRPQILRYEDNPFVYDVLSKYETLTNIPALINTSFNIHEEPIVNNFTDAVITYVVSDIDFLVYNDNLIRKEDLDEYREIILYLFSNRVSLNSYLCLKDALDSFYT